MHNNTEYLKKAAQDIAARKEHSTPNEEADGRLSSEAKRLEADIRHTLTTIDNFTQRDTFHFDTLGRLVDICDILFDIHHRIDPNVQVLLDLLTAVKQIIPAEVRPNLRLPKAFVELHKQPLEAYWAEQLVILQAQAIDPNLIDIAAIPFKEFIAPKHKLYWGNYQWLKAYQRKLEAMDWPHNDCNSKTEALVSLLIAAGLNDDRFFIYCKNIIVDRLAGKTGRKHKLKELANCRKLVLQDSRHKNCPYNPKADPLVTQLLVWVTAEEEYVNVHEPEQPYGKLVFKWSGEMIAGFFKLLHERKVFGSIPLERFAESVAATCTTTDKDELQASTIHSRFYKKDIEQLRALRQVINDILGGLDNMIG